MEIDEIQIEKLSLTPAQKRATKSVYTAMRNAGKIGVHFWDNYGTLTAYNAKRIEVPIMVDDQRGREAMENSDSHFDATTSEVIYYENLKNFHAGNSDDQFFAKVL